MSKFSYRPLGFVAGMYMGASLLTGAEALEHHVDLQEEQELPAIEYDAAAEDQHELVRNIFMSISLTNLAMSGCAAVLAHRAEKKEGIDDPRHPSNLST